MLRFNPSRYPSTGTLARPVLRSLSDAYVLTLTPTCSLSRRTPLVLRHRWSDCGWPWFARQADVQPDARSDVVAERAAEAGRTVEYFHIALDDEDENEDMGRARRPARCRGWGAPSG